MHCITLTINYLVKDPIKRWNLHSDHLWILLQPHTLWLLRREELPSGTVNARTRNVDRMQEYASYTAWRNVFSKNRTWKKNVLLPWFMIPPHHSFSLAHSMFNGCRGPTRYGKTQHPCSCAPRCVCSLYTLNTRTMSLPRKIVLMRGSELRGGNIAYNYMRKIKI